MKRCDVILHRLYGVSSVLFFFTFRSMPGCGGADHSIPPIGPDLRGRWMGVYYRSDRGGQLSLTASISQEGDAVTLSTSKPSGTARLLTGTISGNGDMVLTDAFDGETWTTLFGPATTNHVMLADYVRQPTVEDPDPPVYVLDLTR